MAFIVSIYKYIILLFCFLIIAGLSFALFAASDFERITGQQLTASVVYVVVYGGVFLVMALASTAILISLHDRHREVAEGIDRIATALEQHQGTK